MMSNVAPATATVIEEAHLLVLDQPTFEKMIQENTAIAVRLIKKLAARLERVERLPEVDDLLLRQREHLVGHVQAVGLAGRGHNLAPRLTDQRLLLLAGLERSARPQDVEAAVVAGHKDRFRRGNRGVADWAVGVEAPALVACEYLSV